MHPETEAIHAGRHIDLTTGAVAPPLHLSTTFQRDPDGGYERGYVYSRSGAPNRDEFETLLTRMEGGACAVGFASGQAAASAVFQSLRPGDHVVAPIEIYYGVCAVLEDVFGHWGLTSTFVHMHEAGELEKAITPATKLVWVETPANPMLQITDLNHAANVAHNAGALLAVDNTFATPILQRPIEHAADLVMHATTKWIGGHSDHTGGVVVCAQEGERSDRLRTIQELVGGVSSVFDSWLACRGVRTLAARVGVSTRNAGQIAAHLSSHDSVERVLYPGLSSHPGYDTAKKQMDGFGGMLSFCVKGGRQDAMRVAANVKLITRATSLGGVETLIEHRESIEGPKSTTPANLLRLSVGLENVADLLADLDQALG